MGSSKQYRNVPDSLPSQEPDSKQASPDAAHVRRLQALALLQPSAATAVVRKYPEVGDIKDNVIAARLVLLKRAFPGVLPKLFRWVFWVSHTPPSNKTATTMNVFADRLAFHNSSSLYACCYFPRLEKVQRGRNRYTDADISCLDTPQLQLRLLSK